MFPHDAFQSIATQFGPPVGREEWITIGTGSFSEPNIQDLESFLSQWRIALLAPFTFTADVRSRSGHDIASAQVDQLRRPQPGLKGHHEDRMVPPSAPGRTI